MTRDWRDDRIAELEAKVADRDRVYLRRQNEGIHQGRGLARTSNRKQTNVISTSSTRAALIDSLISNNRFELLGPHTLVHRSPRDTVTVYLADTVVFVFGDGPGVVPSWDVIEVRPRWPGQWEDILQTILSKF